MSNCTQTRTLALLLTLLLFSKGTALAGGLISFDPRGLYAQQADSLNIVTTIREQVAVTITTQLFTNTTTRRTAPVFGMVLPSSAMVTGLRWQINGQWFKATMKSSDTGSMGGGTPSGSGGSDPSRLTTFAREFPSAPFVFPFRDSIAAGTSIRVELTYVELLPYSNGAVRYSITPLAQQNPMRDVTINSWTVDVESGSEIKNINVSPGHLLLKEQTAQRIKLQGANITGPQTTHMLSFEPQFADLTMNVLSTKPANEDGYALMLAVPKTSTGSANVLPKRVTFVIDHSGSMATTRMACAREAAKQCVQNLNYEDIFNVLQFDDEVDFWQVNYQNASPQNVDAATRYIDAIGSDGGTDIMNALSSALQRHIADSYVNVIIFLTDGEASINFDKLRTLNTSATRVFVFGIGQGINPEALTRIGNEHNGATFLIETESNVVHAVTSLFDFIKDPVVKNPKITFSPNVIYDVYPSVVPDIDQGQQLVMVGRYTTPGNVTVMVKGTDRGGEVSMPFAANLTDDPNINVFVAKIWAKYRIDMLLEWMRKEPSNSSRWKEWKDEIVRLGTTYDIVTDYTSLIDDGTRDTGGGSTASVTHDEINIALNRCTISPNPVRESTSIRIDLSQFSRSRVRIEIVDLQGKIVNVLYAEDNAPDILDLRWDGTDTTGARVASGGYQLVVTVDGRRSTAAINVVR